MNRWNISTDFFHVDTWSQKLTADQKIFGWPCSKMSGASLVTRLRNEQMGWSHFFMLMRIWESENLIQLFLCGRIQKWPWLFSSWDPNTCFTLRVNLWIELIFWMLIACNSFWLEWDPTLSLILLFKCRGATAVVLLVFLGKRVDETK